jgi:hypothetical protein
MGPSEPTEVSETGPEGPLETVSAGPLEAAPVEP